MRTNIGGNNMCLLDYNKENKSGLIFNKVKQGKIIHKKEYNNKNKEQRISKMVPAEKSIEYRPKEANSKNDYGHWEGNLVVGK